VPTIKAALSDGINNNNNTVEQDQADLDKVKATLQSLVPIAPSEIKADFTLQINDRNAEQADKDKPSYQASLRSATTHVNSFVKSKCGFDPIL